MDTERPDPHVARLGEAFASHPAWQEAARHLARRSTSTVTFPHRPGEAWRLERDADGARLVPGAAADPDLVFHFPPAAIERLAAVEGDVGDFATTLFALLLDDDPEHRVGLRIVASFPRLVARGYVRLLLAAGPAVLQFGARHGVADLASLRRLVRDLRRRPQEEWEASATAGRARSEAKPSEVE